MFATLPAKKLDEAIAGARIRRFKAGESLWHAGDRITSLCVVAEGLLEAVIGLASGRSSIIELYKPGDIVGSLAYFRGKGALCDVRAVVDASVLYIARSSILERERGEPSWYEILSRSLANRLERQIQLRAICVEASRRKVPGILLWLHESTGNVVPLTQAVLATVAGLTEETVCRSLAPLKKHGLIVVSRGRIEIPAPKALEQYLETL